MWLTHQKLFPTLNTSYSVIASSYIFISSLDSRCWNLEQQPTGWRKSVGWAQYMWRGELLTFHTKTASTPEKSVTPAPTNSYKWYVLIFTALLLFDHVLPKTCYRGHVPMPQYLITSPYAGSRSKISTILPPPLPPRFCWTRQVPPADCLLLLTVFISLAIS